MWNYSKIKIVKFESISILIKLITNKIILSRKNAKFCKMSRLLSDKMICTFIYLLIHIYFYELPIYFLVENICFIIILIEIISRFRFDLKKKSLLRNAKYDCWLCFRLIHGRTRYKENHITKCIMPFFKSIYRIAFFSAGRIFSVFQKNYPKKYYFFVVALVFNFFLMLIIYNLNINHRLFK